MKRDYLVYVEDILDAMDKAELILADVTYEQLVSDFKINFAVVRALEIVGEATKRLPTSWRNQYPQVPWKRMAGMRDRIIHGYDNINLKIVWDVVTQDIPQVKPQIQQIMDDYEDEG